jgi:2-succinyl-6-hydroxy-2,4-cyclohexadiene-1-carboxylate synthase
MRERDDVDLYVEVDGAGPPLLLLHGFTGSARAWDAVRPLLRERARLIVPDLIGHGRSPAPDDPRRYTLEWCVRDLVHVLDVLDVEQADVLGYSMGGRVALRLAVDAPERVRTLLLESTSPGLEDAVERAQRQHADEQLALDLEDRGIEQFVARWERQPLLALAEHVSPRVRAVQHQQRLANSQRGLANSLRGMGAGRQRPLWADLATLPMPTFLLVGERDARYRAIAERMLAALRNGDLMVAPRAGHTVHLDQPELFVRWTLASLTSADNAPVAPRAGW